ncbi:MAG TPA: hypothetical protein VLA79_19760 [Polyangia bacterium]|nr:hypothetical protein [Polyangia bacterium]
MLLTRIKQTTLRLGSRTQAFFRKGEELEATGFENLPHDDPTLVPPKLGFRSFDRVPRNRAPMLIAFLLLATAAVAAFGWLSARDLPHGTARVATSIRAKASSEWVRLKAFVGSRRGP